MKIGIFKLALLLLIATGIVAQTFNIDQFKRKVFKFSNITPGIYELNIGFDDSNELFVAAFGDLDQSTYTDMVVADKAAKVLSVYLWGDKKSSKPLQPFILSFKLLYQ